MKNIQAWGFLVSRNQYLDYRTVVAPSFMCQAGASSILAKAAEGDLTGKDFALYREIHNSKVGDLTLVFRVIEATAEDTGIAGNGVLKDSFGREISLIEGIVFKELVPDVIVTHENIEEIHKQLVEYYRDFWDCTTANSAILSEPLTLQTDNSSSVCLKYNKLKDYIVSTKYQVEKEQAFLKKQNNLWQSLATDKFPGEITSVAYSRDGSFIAFRYDRTLIIRNWNDEQTTHLFSKRKLTGDAPTPVIISEDGEFVATAFIECADQNIVKLWQIRTKEEKEYHRHKPSQLGRVRAIAFIPSSKIIVSGGEDEVLYFSDVISGGEIDKLYGHSTRILSIVINQNEETLASGDGHGVIKLWNLPTRRETQHIQAHLLPVNSLAFSLDSKMLASGSDDYSIKLWNAKTGKEICTIGNHLASVNCVAFSPDGKLIASGSDDCKIKIWELESQSEISVLSGHNNEVTSLAFSPDGQTLVSGSKDCTIRLWQQI